MNQDLYNMLNQFGLNDSAKNENTSPVNSDENLKPQQPEQYTHTYQQSPLYSNSYFEAEVKSLSNSDSVFRPSSPLSPTTETIATSTTSVTVLETSSPIHNDVPKSPFTANKSFLSSIPQQTTPTTPSSIPVNSLTVNLFNQSMTAMEIKLNEILSIVTESQLKIQRLEKDIKELRQQQPPQQPQPQLQQQQQQQQPQVHSPQLTHNQSLQPTSQQPQPHQQPNPSPQITSQPHPIQYAPHQFVQSIPQPHQPGQPLPYIVPAMNYGGFNPGKPQLAHIPVQQPQPIQNNQVQPQSQQGNNSSTFNRDAPPSFPVQQSQNPQHQLQQQQQMPFQPKYIPAQGGYIFAQTQSQQPPQQPPQNPIFQQQPQSQSKPQPQQQQPQPQSQSQPQPQPIQYNSSALKTFACPMCNVQLPEKDIDAHVNSHF